MSMGALILLPDGGFSVSSSGSFRGTFTIPAVPNGPYILLDQFRFGSNASSTPNAWVFYEETSRQLPIVRESFGRSWVNQGGVINPTTLTVTVNGLTPWVSTDKLSLWVPNLGLDLFDYASFAQFGSAPTVGATSTTHAINYSLLNDTALINASQGDLAYAVQTRVTTAGAVVTETIVASSVFSPFTLSSGQPASISATLSSPPSFTQPLSWDLNAFSAVQAQLPAGTNPSGTLRVFTYPVANVAKGFEVLKLTVPAGTTPPTSVTIASPLATSWAHWGSVSFTVAGTRLAPGATTGQFNVGGLFRRAPLSALTGSPITPLLGPVRSPTINGLDLNQPQTGVGLTPVIAWLPPSLGTATRYTLSVYSLETIGTDTRVRSSRDYITRATSVRVPQGVLTPGNPYLVQVSSINDSVTSYANLETPPTLAASGAWVVSAVVRP